METADKECVLKSYTRFLTQHHQSLQQVLNELAASSDPELDEALRSG